MTNEEFRTLKTLIEVAIATVDELQKEYEAETGKRYTPPIRPYKWAEKQLEGYFQA